MNKYMKEDTKKATSLENDFADDKLDDSRE